MLLSIKLDLINLEISYKLSWECIKIKKTKSKVLEVNSNYGFFVCLLLFYLCVLFFCWAPSWPFNQMFKAVFPNSSEVNFQTIYVLLFCSYPLRTYSELKIILSLKWIMCVLGLVWFWHPLGAQYILVSFHCLIMYPMHVFIKMMFVFNWLM